MKQITPLIMITIIALFGAACSENASYTHAKNTVTLLDKMQTQARTGAGSSAVINTLVEAKQEYKKIGDKDIDPDIYISLGLSIMDFQSAVDVGGTSGKDALDAWASGVKNLKDARKRLGMPAAMQL